MRLWHKSLINVLPKQQFLGQIRELTAICKDIQNNGKTNHILINKITDYNLKHLYTYCKLIEQVAKERKINITQNTLQKWYNTFTESEKQVIDFDSLFKSWCNANYMAQHYYNLEENGNVKKINDNEFNLVRKVSIEYGI